MHVCPGAASTSRFLLGGLLVLALAGAARPLEAAAIVFNDRSAFISATQPNVFENFDGPLQPCTFLPGCEVTYSGITFRFDNATPPYSPPSPPAALDFIKVGPTFVVQAHFDPVTAIGFDTSALGGAFGLTVFPLGCGAGCEVGPVLQPDGSVVFGTGHSLTQPGFIGFVSTDSSVFNGLLLAPTLGDPSRGIPNSIVAVDNLALAVNVPEPATLLLFAIAGSALVGGRRYMRHAKDDSARSN
jgi:PEP-CTERM motif-containing protein